LDDLIDVRNRIIGSGRIGKATGMLLARRILLNEKGKVDFSQVLEAHDSFYIGSDVFFTFWWTTTCSGSFAGYETARFRTGL
jgi:hypothetical protein